VKDQTLTVADLVKQITAKTGEKISIRRFTRYKMGEGLEKRADDFGQEIAKLTNQ
jgi:elongation factor Ts